MTLAQDLQQPVVDAYIELFQIDLTGIGGIIYYFTNTTDGAGGSIVWNGNTYVPFPIKIEGISQTSEGAETRPSLKVSAVDTLFRGLIATLDDLVGGVVIYSRTTAKYLNTGISSPPFTYSISRKIAQNRSGIAWEIKTDLDFDRKFLPKSQMLRDGNRAFPGLGINKQAGT